MQAQTDGGYDAITGRCWLRQFHGGLTLHVTDGVETKDQVIVDETDRRLCALLFLQGGADIALGRTPLHFGQPGHRGEAALMAVAGPDRFVRYLQRGVRVTKVCVSLDLEWLAATALTDTGAGQALTRFATAHGRVERWQASDAQRTLAQALLYPSGETPLFETLRLESQALAFAAQMLRPIAADRGPASPLTARDRASLRRACGFLDTLAEDDFRLADVAKAAGMSVSALQRLFRAAFGTTVVAYLRGRRLEQARDLLARDQISVTEAAFLAGYSDPANFAKAFRRRFGCAPSAVR